MVRFGVIGYGKQGQLYSSILSGTPHWGGATLERPKDCILTAVSARDPRCREQIEALPNVRYFQDWRELPCVRTLYDAYLERKIREE